MPNLRQALKQLLTRVLDKDSPDSVWDRDGYGSGCTETGFSATYEVNMQRLDEEIDEFCAQFESNGGTNGNLSRSSDAQVATQTRSQGA